MSTPWIDKDMKRSLHCAAGLLHHEIWPHRYVVVPEGLGGDILTLSYTPRPRSSFLDTLERMHHTGKPRWRNKRGHIYEYDPEHGGELEVYNKQGLHLGVADVHTGEFIKPARKGRRIDV
ncbi:colicin E3/pyocin S6 family cytotoxin [Micromonospora fluostatini]|uniref:colicin E3/pyocin S6 family cytotoxin n=1 Tax=Micromonospora sp. JCM 30529 TaxID=3421643 RepID=UPI003D174308